MNQQSILSQLAVRTPSRICLLVLEGLGDIPVSGRTALEAADCPCLDKLAVESECGLLIPVGPGITPDPVTALLALLGYDPLENGLDDATLKKLLNGRPLSDDARASLPTLAELYHLKPAAVAVKPFARGVAQLAGMDIIDTDVGIDHAFRSVTAAFEQHDFLFSHIPLRKDARQGSRFKDKVAAIEAFDHNLPGLLALEPDVIVVTGAYSVFALVGVHAIQPRRAIH